MRSASAESAFFLYAKKGNEVAAAQLMGILIKLVRVGLTDSD